MKNNSKTYLIIAAVLVLIVGISIGYAALSATLNISGRTNIKKATWNVHFTNLNVKEGSAEATTPATISASKTDINYNVKLNKPGDYYEFTVDVVNNGTIAAKLAIDPTVSGLTEAQKQYISYTVSYSDGAKVSEGDELSENQTETIKVRVEFKKDITAAQLPTEEQNIDLTFAMNFIQA